MTEAKGPYRHLPGGPTLPACWPECPACAYARGVADERERCARIASVEWSNGKNSVVRAEELASNLCQRIENKR